MERWCPAYNASSKMEIPTLLVFDLSIMHPSRELVRRLIILKHIENDVFQQRSRRSQTALRCAIWSKTCEVWNRTSPPRFVRGDMVTIFSCDCCRQDITFPYGIMNLIAVCTCARLILRWKLHQANRWDSTINLSVGRILCQYLSGAKMCIDVKLVLSGEMRLSEKRRFS